jgi:tRNA-specific 2-thiouridylase
MKVETLLLDQALEEVQAHLQPMPPCTVVLGLSGGVDSAVSAWLLQQLGYPVVGLFMKNWEDDDDEGHCSSRQDWLDAASVADVLGIELEAVNFAEEYRTRVFEGFLAEYRAGRTPNPDVLCNTEIKFRAFLDHALRLGADRIATGHYARISIERSARANAGNSARIGAGHATPGGSEDSVAIRRGNDPRVEAGDQRKAASPPETGISHRLLKGIDAYKDQSYFLHRLNQAQLARSVFPLGGLRKAAVRRIAGALGLSNAAKKDSTGICFIGERPFREFLQRYLPNQPGPILDPRGRCVGEHLGLAFYTLGQRKGLGIGGTRQSESAAAWYVARKEPETNALRVVQGHDHPWLMSTQLSAGQASWILGAAPEACDLKGLAAKTRYRQSDAPLRAFLPGSGIQGFRLIFQQPQWAVTPGQSAVLYHGETCLGGGVIEDADCA